MAHKSLGFQKEMLPVKLTMDEITQKGQELARVEGDMEIHEASELNVKASLKSRRAALEADRQRIALAIRSKEESREIDVERVADFKSGVLNMVRTDTGEVIFTRALLESERQISMELA